MTFDKRVYSFEAECDYLLARDFIDGKFSVVVSYQRTGGKMTKSLIFMDGSKQVKVMPEGQIMLNGRAAELPLVMGATVVLREANQVIIKNKHGIMVECDLEYDRCTVEVSGWYHGKLAGLLGTFDNEPINDMIKSDGSRARDLDDFVQSWAVKSQCRSARNMARTQEPVPDTTPWSTCAPFFNQTTSMYKRCFKVINPRMAMQKCVDDVAAGNTICAAAETYYKQCLSKEIHLKMPTECRE